MSDIVLYPDAPASAFQYPDWHRDAACRDEDPEAFYPDRRQDAGHALIICRSCPVRVKCLTDAIERGEQWGIHGGRDFERAGRRAVA